MTSIPQAQANRGEARRRTGPHTHAGKARARMNALRHGLAARLRPGEQAAEEHDRVARLARILAGGRSEGAVLASAAALAECSIDLARARAAEVRLIARYHDVAALPSAPDEPDAQAPQDHAQDIVQTGEILLTSIASLDRYGRQARARRRRALRAYAILGCTVQRRL